MVFILKFCCMCNKTEYMYMNTRQRTKAEGAEGVEFGEGLCPLPENFGLLLINLLSS